MKAIYKIAILSLLTSCFELSQQEKTKDVYTALDIQPSFDKSIESTFFVQGSWPNPTWWEEFHSPILSQLIEASITNNPTLHVLQARIMEAQSIAYQARAKLFPWLSLQGDDDLRLLSKHEFNHILNPTLPLHGYQADLLLSLNYEFDFWNKNRNLFHAAIGKTKAEEAELAFVTLLITSALAQNYFTLVIDHAKQELFLKLNAIQKERLTLQYAMEKSALASKLPSLLDEELYNMTKQALYVIQEEIEIRTHAVNVLIGRSPDHPIAIDEIATTLPPLALPLDLSVELLSRRPDLHAALWRIESFAYEISAAKAEFLPNVNLVALGGYASVQFATLFRSSSKHLGIAPAFTLPLFTGGSIRAHVKQKEALFQQAVFQYNETLLQSIQEVCDVLSHMRSSFAQKLLQQDTVTRANERLILIEKNQLGGLESTFANLIYQDALLQESLKDLALLNTEYTLTCKLIQALGGGFMSASPLKESHP